MIKKIFVAGSAKSVKPPRCFCVNAHAFRPGNNCYRRQNLEANLTSGAADLPEFFVGKSKRLDYKTLRHVGHYAWVDGVIRQFPNDTNLPKILLEKFLQEVPAVEDDFVLAHASVEGFDDKGVRRLIEKAFFVEPLEINGHFLRAIQTTTAVPLLESAMMLLTGKYKGVVLQSQISPQEFLNGGFISKIYKTKI